MATVKSRLVEVEHVAMLAACGFEQRELSDVLAATDNQLMLRGLACVMEEAALRAARLVSARLKCVPGSPGHQETSVLVEMGQDAEIVLRAFSAMEWANSVKEVLESGGRQSGPSISRYLRACEVDTQAWAAEFLARGTRAAAPKALTRKRTALCATGWLAWPIDAKLSVTKLVSGMASR